MTTHSTTTPCGVSKTPNPQSELEHLRNFSAMVALLAASIEANALVAECQGDLAMWGYEADAADKRARCEMAVAQVAVRDDTPPALAIAAEHIRAVLEDEGTAPHYLTVHSFALARMARHLAHSPGLVERCSAVLLERAAQLLSVIIADAMAEAEAAAEAAETDLTLSIPEIIAL